MSWRDHQQIAVTHADADRCPGSLMPLAHGRCSCCNGAVGTRADGTARLHKAAPWVRERLEAGLVVPAGRGAE